MTTPNLTDHTAIITGATGQIGLATAQRLALQGCRVLGIVRRDLAQAQQTLDQLPNNHLGHRAFLADVRKTESIRAAMDQIRHLSDRCDILINSAGISLPTQTPEDTTDDIFDDMIATNLRGTWVVIRECLPMLQAAPQALVINMSSVSSVATRPNSLGYSVSKAGVNAMTECLAKSLGPKIRFVAIAPCMLTKGTSGQPSPSPELHQTFANNIPLKRMGTAEDVADVIESLATKIKFYNGHLIVLDGGLTL